MADNGTTGGNGIVKLCAAVLGLIAVVAGVYSMVEPMGQRIDFLQQELAEIRAELVHSDGKHMLSVSDRAATHEKFVEVETQFLGMRELMDLQFKLLREETNGLQVWAEEHDLRVRGINSGHTERLNALERVVFKEKPSDGTDGRD